MPLPRTQAGFPFCKVAFSWVKEGICPLSGIFVLSTKVPGIWRAYPSNSADYSYSPTQLSASCSLLSGWKKIAIFTLDRTEEHRNKAIDKN